MGELLNDVKRLEVRLSVMAPALKVAVAKRGDRLRKARRTITLARTFMFPQADAPASPEADAPVEPSSSAEPEPSSFAELAVDFRLRHRHGKTHRRRHAVCNRRKK